MHIPVAAHPLLLPAAPSGSADFHASAAAARAARTSYFTRDRAAEACAFDLGRSICRHARKIAAERQAAHRAVTAGAAR